MNKRDGIFTIVFSFVFPLTLITWGLKDRFERKTRIIAYEGMLFNLTFLLLILMFKYLSLIPLLGIVFSFFFSIVFYVYILFTLIIVIVKAKNPDYELPFLTMYAENLVRG